MCLTFCDSMDCSLPGFSVYGIFPGKSTGVGCHFLLQGIFLTQGSNLGLPHFRQMLYPLSHHYGTCLPRAQGAPCYFSSWIPLRVVGQRLAVSNNLSLQNLIVNNTSCFSLFAGSYKMALTSRLSRMWEWSLEERVGEFLRLWLSMQYSLNKRRAYWLLGDSGNFFHFWWCDKLGMPASLQRIISWILLLWNLSLKFVFSSDGIKS